MNISEELSVKPEVYFPDTGKVYTSEDEQKEILRESVDQMEWLPFGPGDKVSFPPPMYEMILLIREQVRHNIKAVSINQSIGSMPLLGVIFSHTKGSSVAYWLNDGHSGLCLRSDFFPSISAAKILQTVTNT